MRINSIIISLCVGGMLLFPGICAAAKAMENEAVFIEADVMNYAEQEGVVTASGNVQIVQGSRVLLADQVTYHKAENLVLARGNISLLEPGGAVFFANEAELQDDLRNAVIDEFSARMKDGALFAAAHARRKNDSVIELERAVFSPCSVCRAEPGSSPQWQMKSRKVTIDEEKERVVHNHSFFEVYGTPVFYTPYLSHPTPGAKRKSGFLTPSYGNDGNLGEYVRVPYYFNIAPEMDVTTTMSVYTGVDPMMQGEFRHLTEKGEYSFKGSATHADVFDEDNIIQPDKELRAHIEGSGKFELDNAWELGFQGMRSTDDTYLRRYRLFYEDTLTTHGYAQLLEKDNYITVDALSFQELNDDDDPAQTPLVLPLSTLHVESEPGTWNSRTILDANILALHRDAGVKSNRISATGAWLLPYVSDNGHVFEMKTSLRADGYAVRDVPQETGEPLYTGLAGRVIPQAELKWRYPLSKRIDAGRLYVEPITHFIVSPYGGNPSKIPNEDSQDVEFSDENLFNANHFTGYDRLESGPRTNYGVRTALHTPGWGNIHTLVGQSYRAKENDDFSTKSGLSEQISDYVGQVGYRYGSYFNGSYQFRLDKDNLSPSKNELNARMNVEPLDVSVVYLSLDDGSSVLSSQDQSRELIVASAGVQVSDNWRTVTQLHRDLANGQWISNENQLVYEGDCTTFITSWRKDFTSDRDVQAATTISFQVLLSNF